MSPRAFLLRLSLKMRLALVGTAAAAVLLLALTLGVNEVIRHVLIADVDSRLNQGTAAVTQEISEPPADENGLENLDPEFREPVVAWWYDSQRRPLTVPDVAPTPPPLDASVGTSPGLHDIRLANTHFRVLVTSTAGGATVATGVSLAGVDSTLASIHHVEELIEPAILVLFLVGGYAVARSALGPVERLRRTAERVGTEAEGPRFSPTPPLDELGLLAQTFDHMLDRLDLVRERSDQLSAEASHELRTPLGVIEAETSLALERPRAADYYRQALTRVGGEVRRMRRVVDELLWLARTDRGATIPAAVEMDLSLVARHSVLRLQPMAKARRQDLLAEAPSSPVPVLLPEGWLERVVDNLVDNACKYSPEKATITVSVIVTDAGTGGQGKCTLEVTDTGPGIAAADRARVMGRFERAAGKEPGSGLGLAIVDAIVRSSHGRWSIDNTSAGGTRVSIVWPEASAPS